MACRAEARRWAVTLARLRFATARQPSLSTALRAKAGTRGEGRTLNLRLRRPTLYPIELLAQDKPTIRTRVPLLNANCRNFALPSHCSLIPLDGFQPRMVFRPTLNLQTTGEMLHPILRAKKRGTAHSRPRINCIAPQISFSAEPPGHPGRRPFRHPDADRPDADRVGSSSGIYQIAPESGQPSFGPWFLHGWIAFWSGDLPVTGWCRHANRAIFLSRASRMGLTFAFWSSVRSSFLASWSTLGPPHPRRTLSGGRSAGRRSGRRSVGVRRAQRQIPREQIAGYECGNNHRFRYFHKLLFVFLFFPGAATLCGTAGCFVRRDQLGKVTICATLLLPPEPSFQCPPYRAPWK